MTDEQERPEEKAPAYTPEDGLPGPKEIEHRREQAARILLSRRIGMGAAAPQQMALLLAGVARLLKHRGVAKSDDELQYFIDLAEVEGMEEVVANSTSAMAPVIHISRGPLS